MLQTGILLEAFVRKAMKKKMFVLLLAAALISIGSFAQSSKDKIEKQAKDPATRENAAKADNYCRQHKTGGTKSRGHKAASAENKR